MKSRTTSTKSSLTKRNLEFPLQTDSQGRKFRASFVAMSTLLRERFKFCGYEHAPERKKCPAWGKVCKRCKKKNHFAKGCKDAAVNAIESDEDLEEISVVRVQAMKDKAVFAEMLVQQKPVRFQIDCGASANILPCKYVEDVDLEPCSQSLVMWNGTKVKPVGTCALPVINPRNNTKYNVRFSVVKESLTPLLGLNATEKMSLLTVHKENFVSVVENLENDLANNCPDVFDNGLGKLPGKVHLQVDPACQPVILPARKVPVSVNLKKNSRRNCVLSHSFLRLCMQQREVLTVHTFSILSCSLLTTFATPHGRYRWLRLPFGLCVSSEIFQKHLNQELLGLPGVKCIADDVLIYGRDDADHDSFLEGFMKKCQQRGIKLNRAKLEYKCKEVPFHGHVLTSEGLKPDPQKVEAITEMPRPEKPEDELRLNSMVNYLSRFLPNLSDVMKPLRDLIHKDVERCWSDAQERAWDEVKGLIASAPVLAYYKPGEPLAVQYDSSHAGLGAALMQSVHPIAYASRALTETETRYAQMEKEMLAIVFAVETFNDYTFGDKTFVFSNHKPLESILKKPLNRAPKRLQGMIIRLQKYDLEVRYEKGRKMFLADTLSRAFLPAGKQDENEFETINMMKYLPVPEERLLLIQKDTEADESLQVLKAVIQKGWPEHKSNVPSIISLYFNMRD